MLSAYATQTARKVSSMSGSGMTGSSSGIARKLATEATSPSRSSNGSSLPSQVSVDTYLLGETTTERITHSFRSGDRTFHIRRRVPLAPSTAPSVLSYQKEKPSRHYHFCGSIGADDDTTRIGDTTRSLQELNQGLIVRELVRREPMAEAEGRNDFGTVSLQLIQELQDSRSTIARWKAQNEPVVQPKAFSKALRFPSMLRHDYLQTKPLFQPESQLEAQTETLPVLVAPQPKPIVQKKAFSRAIVPHSMLRYDYLQTKPLFQPEPQPQPEPQTEILPVLVPYKPKPIVQQKAFSKASRPIPLKHRFQIATAKDLLRVAAQDAADIAREWLGDEEDALPAPSLEIQTRSETLPVLVAYKPKPIVQQKAFSRASKPIPLKHRFQVATAKDLLRVAARHAAEIAHEWLGDEEDALPAPSMAFELDAAPEPLRYELDATPAPARFELDATPALIRHELDATPALVRHELDANPAEARLELDATPAPILSEVDATPAPEQQAEVETQVEANNGTGIIATLMEWARTAWETTKRITSNFNFME